MKVNVLGWYNHDNIGDDAFKIVFPSSLPQHLVECVENLTDTTVDAVVLGGGDVVYPAFTNQIFKQDFASKQKIAASVTITPNSDLHNLREFDHIYVRDYRSMSLAQKYSSSNNVSYLPDFTFLLQPDVAAGRTLLEKLASQQGHELKDKVVIVVMSAYITYTQADDLRRDSITFQFIAQNLATIADSTEVSFVFLPFSTKPPYDDRTSNGWVAQHCMRYDKNVVVMNRMSVQDTLNIISASNVVISTRLHATIFSVIGGVPFIDLTHHDKNLGFIETIGRTEWSLPLWEFGINHFKNLLWDALKRPWPDQALLDITKQSRQHLLDTNILL